jgi:hypothetical protein
MHVNAFRRHHCATGVADKRHDVHGPRRTATPRVFVEQRHGIPCLVNVSWCTARTTLAEKSMVRNSFSHIDIGTNTSDLCQQPCASQFRKPKMPSLAQTMQGPYFLCCGSAGNGPLAPISSGQTSIYRQIDLQGVAVEHGHWPVGSE